MFTIGRSHVRERWGYHGGVRLIVADSYLWYQHRKGFKDAALPYVTNVWLRAHALIWSDGKTHCLFLRIRLICTPESLRSMCTPLKSFRVMLHDNRATWVSYMKRKKRPKDAKSITSGVCALRCHLLHVNQQRSRRGPRRGGLGDLIVENCQQSKSFNSSQETIHRLPPLNDEKPCLENKINPTMCGFVSFPNEKYIPYCYCSTCWICVLDQLLPSRHQFDTWVVFRSLLAAFI